MAHFVAIAVSTTVLSSCELRLRCLSVLRCMSEAVAQGLHAHAAMLCWSVFAKIVSVGLLWVVLLCFTHTTKRRRENSWILYAHLFGKFEICQNLNLRKLVLKTWIAKGCSFSYRQKQYLMRKHCTCPLSRSSVTTTSPQTAT